jgi:phosphoglycerate kinase
MGILLPYAGCGKIMGSMTLRTLEDVEVAGKTVLLRVDLNVPMQGGIITDDTRIARLKPTLQYLIKKKARIVLLSHFGRPKGQFVPSLSLAPLANALKSVAGKSVHFGVDCVGSAAKDAVAKLKPGEVILLENLRFHPEEEKGDTRFAHELANLGDVFINDAFSCSHRAHASITGITKYLPSAAGRLMQMEIEELDSIFASTRKPVTAIIGGSKISSKLELLENLIGKVDNLIIGGAMANTFLLAQGHDVGKSLVETDLKKTAKRILDKAKKQNCNIILPTDVVTGTDPQGGVSEMVGVDSIPHSAIAFDIGNETFVTIAQCLKNSKTALWNGPLGMFESQPFEAGTLMVAREIAALTRAKKLKSIAGGGDTLAALALARMTESFSYISTAGGAFLEWLEGKTLPGVAVLLKAKQPIAKAR